MKFKKTIFLSLLILSVLVIYSCFGVKKENYVSLGDSVARGINSYGEDGYGYTDHLKDYFKKKNKLKTYVDFSVSGYKTSDILEDLETNKKVTTNKTEYNIRNALRESTIVTISIGANDFLSKIDVDNLSFNDITPYKNTIKSIIPDVNKVLKEVRKYAKNKVIVVGYYNPIPFLFNTNRKEMDELFALIDDEYKKITKENDMEYISMYETFKNNGDFLPNPMNIHPNAKGYEAIFEKIKESITKK